MGKKKKKRAMVACGVSFNDGDSGTDNTDSAIRIQRAGMGVRVSVLDGYGDGHLLCLLSHVQGA